jgi:hypothetical protein
MTNRDIASEVSSLAAAVMEQQRQLAALLGLIHQERQSPAGAPLHSGAVPDSGAQRAPGWRTVTNSLTAGESATLYSLPVNPMFKAAAKELKAMAGSGPLDGYLDRPGTKLSAVGVHASKSSEVDGIARDGKRIRRLLALAAAKAEDGDEFAKTVTAVLGLLHVRHRNRVWQLREEEKIESVKARKALQQLHKERDDGALDTQELAQREANAREVERVRKDQLASLQLRVLEAKLAKATAGGGAGRSVGQAKKGGGGGNKSDAGSANTNTNITRPKRGNTNKAPASDKPAGADNE